MTQTATFQLEPERSPESARSPEAEWPTEEPASEPSLTSEPSPTPDSSRAATLRLEFEGRTIEVAPEAAFEIGREADLSLNGNRFLHRRFLRLVFEHGFWWLVNVGSSLSATVSDPVSGTQAWLGPGARLPITFAQLAVQFTAGPCAYEIRLRHDSPLWQEPLAVGPSNGDTTVTALPLTPTQRQLIVALAEPVLRREGAGVIHIPSNAEAARRLGWNMSRFNRKLDNVCGKLDRLGVDGMRGGVSAHATNRRARLIEWAVSTGLVTGADLALLDQSAEADDWDDDQPGDDDWDGDSPPAAARPGSPAISSAGPAGPAAARPGARP
ncbi:MAG: hypothetical protein LBK42_11165 [Propionibacteriaceae bacterium]|nr:hypothetical protein [Propionibacteriaceae bacterium]